MRAWTAQLPTWLEVRAPAAIDPNIKLGLGEMEAICLARELHADTVLIDERKAAKLAQQMGLLVTGTLGVLVTASQRGMIRLGPVLDALPPSFRAPEALLQQLRAQALKWER